MYKKKYVRKKIIFISIIISMSIIGVGYATWDDGTQINLSLKTGFIKPLFLLENERINFNNGKLSLSLHDNRRTLHIDGEIYPSFNEDISIKIADEGTIPSVFEDLYKEDKNISDLNIDSSFNKNNIDSFELNINPNSDDDKLRKLSENCINSNAKIIKLDQEIEDLKEKIKLYNKEENYEFQYILTFNQGL
nr:hypothetical protein [Sedimentibacter sp.]